MSAPFPPPSGSAAHVTDHAVVRYLERVWGVDVGALRRRIAREAATGLEHGAAAVNRGDVKFVLDGATVITVMPRRAHARLKPERRP